VEVTFTDGFSAVIKLRPFLDKGIAAELLAPEKFALVMVEEGGGISWPNGFDVCPEFLRELATKRQAAA
jgi:hypothetical protein